MIFLSLFSISLLTKLEKTTLFALSLFPVSLQTYAVQENAQFMQWKEK